MITYWRFTHVGGELCGPCAWVLGYQRRWQTINVHESSKLMIACSRCYRNVWTVASYDTPLVEAWP